MNLRLLTSCALVTVLLVGCGSRSDDIDARLSAIQGAVQTLEHQRADLDAEVEKLKGEVEEMRSALEEANDAAAAAQDDVDTLKVQLKRLHLGAGPQGT